MIIDDVVKELEQHARHLGYQLRVIQKHPPSGTQTLEIGLKVHKHPEPRLTSIQRDWRTVG